MQSAAFCGVHKSLNVFGEEDRSESEVNEKNMPETCLRRTHMNAKKKKIARACVLLFTTRQVAGEDPFRCCEVGRTGLLPSVVK